MAEWWESCPAEAIVDYFVETLNSPQYPSAGVFMHITDEETLAKARGIILRAEVASKSTIQTLHCVAVRPYQYHCLPMPHDALREYRDVYASVIRQLIALGVVRDVQANYGW